MKEQLPGFVLAELFHNSIVNIEDEFKTESTIKDAPKQKNWYLGNYEKRIIVLVNDNNNTYLSDENLNFLSGILNACKLNLAQIGLINFSNNPVNFIRLKNDMNPEFLLLFGVSVLEIDLPFTMPHYQVQNYDNCSIFTAPVLTELNQPTPEAKKEKSKVWKSLQTLFNLEK